MTDNIIIILIVLLIVGLAILYIYRSKNLYIVQKRIQLSLHKKYFYFVIFSIFQMVA